MNSDKTEVMWVGKQREELNIRLEGKDMKPEEQENHAAVDAKSMEAF